MRYWRALVWLLNTITCYFREPSSKARMKEKENLKDKNSLYGHSMEKSSTRHGFKECEMELTGNVNNDLCGVASFTVPILEAKTNPRYILYHGALVCGRNGKQLTKTGTGGQLFGPGTHQNHDDACSMKRCLKRFSKKPACQWLLVPNRMMRNLLICTGMQCGMQ